eukprot:834484-Karenia_brevis.AAC.1
MQLQKATSKTALKEPGRPVITRGFPHAFGHTLVLCIAFTRTIANAVEKYPTMTGLGENGKVKRYRSAQEC